jgi:putative oxidoreductase
MTNQLLSREASVAPRTVDTAQAAAADAPPLWKRLFATPDDRAALVLRLVLGGVMLPHGAQKVLGWFGGPGLSGTMEFFTGTMGIPAPFAALAIAAESLGALALLAGAGTRVAALGIAAVMAGAVAMVHLPNGFFMNWFGNQKGEGFEYHLLAIGIAAALVVRGGGAWSVDRRIARV